MPSSYVTTSPLSLARLLWWYGEVKLWAQALGLEPRAVADLAEEFAHLRTDKDALFRIWPEAPRDGYLLIPIIELLEGATRPAARKRRRPQNGMPAVLDVTEEGRWNDPGFAEVCRLVDARKHGPQL